MLHSIDAALNGLNTFSLNSEQVSDNAVLALEATAKKHIETLDQAAIVYAELNAENVTLRRLYQEAASELESISAKHAHLVEAHAILSVSFDKLIKAVHAVCSPVTQAGQIVKFSPQNAERKNAAA